MYKETTGRVISTSKQLWFKVNTKPFRTHAFDGAIFPYVIKVGYTVGGKDYIKRKWISAGSLVPFVGGSVKVVYREDKPAKAKIQ